MEEDTFAILVEIDDKDYQEFEDKMRAIAKKGAN
jgi:hypothetical protein